LAADGIVVKVVMLRDIQLPPEYAQGLETLLLKEQENDRMGVDDRVEAETGAHCGVEAEATKVQQIKQAEGEAQVHVLQAKGESDAMQYTLPLKRNKSSRASWRRKRARKRPSKMRRQRRRPR
jgi:regulator of protease activity HflC (stomatin/prohibitin superfamily)